MLSCRPKFVAAFLGAVVVAISASSASALPSLRSHSTDAVFSGNVLLSGADEIVRTLMPEQGTFFGALQAGNGHIQDDRWKHKKYDKVDKEDENPPSDLPEPPTLWLFGAGLAVLILFSLRKRLAPR